MKNTRAIFAELTEGFDSLNSQREGKLTLRTFKVDSKPAPVLSPHEAVGAREQSQLSRPVFARHLLTNPRTLKNWEQGRAKPNAQAALLIRMVTEPLACGGQSHLVLVVELTGAARRRELRALSCLVLPGIPEQVGMQTVPNGFNRGFEDMH